VIDRAREVLGVLEGEHLTESARGQRSTAAKASAAAAHDQLGLFAVVRNPVVEVLKAVDVNAMTPLEALTLVARLADEARRDG
jgi:DNA mismatch repair ATPase MutS